MFTKWRSKIGAAIGESAAGERKPRVFKIFRKGVPFFILHFGVMKNSNGILAKVEREWRTNLLFTNRQEVQHVLTALQNYGILCNRCVVRFIS